MLRLASVDLGRQRRHHHPRRGVRLRPRLPRPAEGRRHRHRPRAAGHRRLRPEPRPTCWRAWSGPGRGLELVSNVNDIPKGSRLAVSTNLLAALIAVCMRATGQAALAHRPAATEDERRLVAARAILGEWLGGSGGGWQDSGGVWPGIKLIEGVARQRRATPSSASAAAACCPRHRILDRRRRPGRHPPEAAGLASCSSTAAWRRTSARSSRW